MSVLIIGGSSGLGFALANEFKRKGEDVFITGRIDPGVTRLKFHTFHIHEGWEMMSVAVDSMLAKIGKVTTLVYSAGFLESGPLGQQTAKEIGSMIGVGLAVPALIVSKLLSKQDIPGIIFVTSTSQWIPRLNEPVYTATKAGLGMLGNSLALDPKVGKVLVAGPAGMDTKFFEGGEKREGELLSPDWVAGSIMKEWERKFIYKTIRILRDPPRILYVEERLHK